MKDRARKTADTGAMQQQAGRQRPLPAPDHAPMAGLPQAQGQEA